MKSLFKQTALIACGILILTSCDKDAENQNNHSPSTDNMEVTLAYGDSTAIIGKINQFREHTGTPVNTTPVATNGRREINWDGVPPDLLNERFFPANFFNSLDRAAPDGRKRGLICIPANASLRVSDNNFSDIDSSYATQFRPFSHNKLFSANGRTITEVVFKVPGTDQNAYINSFGLVFSDVDIPDATMVEAYEGERLIAKVYAQPADKNFSFVGLHSHDYKITRVKITSGTSPLAAGVRDGDNTDVVVMDDFIYGEPKAY